MMIEISMGPDYDRTAASLSAMGRNILVACSEGLFKGVTYAATHVASEYLTGQALKSRSGLLAKAVQGWLAAPFDGVVGVVAGSAVEAYKWLLSDEQKVIRPVRSKFLAIPIGENLTAAGVAKYSSPRQVPEGFFVTSKGRLLFGYKRGERGKFRVLFALVKSVFVQGSGALYDGVVDAEPRMVELIAAEVERKVPS